MTARFCAANTAELYYDSLQYEGKASWETEVALNRRKPREIIPLFKTAIDTVHSFIWGGSRFPRIIVAATRTEDSDDDEIGPRLWNDDALALTTFVQEVVRAAKLDRAVAEFSRKALITTSCAVLLHFKAGKLRYSVEPGKHCTPQWSADDPSKLQSLDICYKFTREEQIQGTSGVRTVEYWFRRIIDEQNDTVFLPVKATGTAPVWTVDSANSVNHALGYCPVVWVRALSMSSDAVDGVPVIDPALYKLLDRINYVYSLRGRSVEYNLDPQWVRRNVPSGDRQALQKSTTKIWDIEDAGKDKPADIKLIESQGSGSVTASDLTADLHKRFCEAVRIVIADADAVKGRNVSGVVLEYLHQPMVALASELRKDLGDDAFADIINLALRMICTVKTRGEEVFIQGASKAVKLMMTAQLGGPWLDFPIRLQWGRFFSPTAQDQLVTVQTATLAAQGGLASKAKAIGMVADAFAITDIDAEVDQIEKEQAAQLDYGSLDDGPLGDDAAPGKASAKPKPSKKPAKPNRPGKA